MRRFAIFFLLGALLCCAGCSSVNSGPEKKGPAPAAAKKKPQKKKPDTSWIREQFHREKVTDKDIRVRVLDDFEPIPGHKGYRSRTLKDESVISLW